MSHPKTTSNPSHKQQITMVQHISQEDINAADRVNFIEYLKNIGYTPVSIKPDSALFHSPLREDRNPSFSVGLNNGRWVWHDFATRDSGDFITFIRHFLHLSFPDAVRHLLTHASFTYTPKPLHTHRQSRKNTIEKIKHWYGSLKDSQSPSHQQQIRDYFTTLHLPWHPEMGSILLTLNPDKQKPHIRVPYVTTPIPTANLNDMQALECRALHTVHPDYRRRCVGPKALWRLHRPGQPLIITESIIDCLAADQLFDQSFDLIALNSTRNIALVRPYLEISSPSQIILALDNDQKKDRGQLAQEDLLRTINSLNIPISTLTLHHQTGHKDLHKVLMDHPQRQFRLNHYLTNSHSSHSSHSPSFIVI